MFLPITHHHHELAKWFPAAIPGNPEYDETLNLMKNWLGECYADFDELLETDEIPEWQIIKITSEDYEGGLEQFLLDDYLINKEEVIRVIDSDLVK